MEEENTEKNHLSWYWLPEDYRESLIKKNDIFYKFKDSGLWGLKKEIDKYGPDAIAVLRRRGCIFYDTMMPWIAEAVTAKSLRIAIFPIGMKIVDIVFYKSKEKTANNSDENNIQLTGM